MRDSILKSVAAIAGAAFLGGCLEVTPAKVKRIGVEAVNIQTFAPSNYQVEPSTGLPTVTLRNVKVFLWLGEQPEPTKVSSVKVISREVDRLDDVGFDLTAERLALETQADSAYLRWMEGGEEFSRAERERNTAKRRLDAELAKPAEQQDQVKVQQYRDQITAAEGKMAAAQTKIDQALADAAAANLDLEQVAAQIAEIEAKVGENTALGQSQVDQLTEVVDFYSQQPESIRIEFLGDDRVNVSVKEWDVCLLYKAFQEENVVVDPNLGGEWDERCVTYEVTDTSYEPFGGRVKFTVKAGTGAEFRFNLVRTRYADRYQRVFFQGRVEGRFTLTDGRVLVRTGIAKLVDKKNN
ncbi:MAG: hypothetical protein IT285_11090 [Bdellovibrionales bacterium]|nr:hypothetical protein [Bdellovibrionales bacterium]